MGVWLRHCPPHSPFRLLRSILSFLLLRPTSPCQYLHLNFMHCCWRSVASLWMVRGSKCAWFFLPHFPAFAFRLTDSASPDALILAGFAKKAVSGSFDSAALLAALRSMSEDGVVSNASTLASTRRSLKTRGAGSSPHFPEGSFSDRATPA